MTNSTAEHTDAPVQALRILLVEDNPGDARLVQEHLGRDDGWAEIVVINQLRNAASALADSRFDVVLLDLSLPDSDPAETIEFINSIASTAPVIVLSGNADFGLAMQAVRNGAQGFIRKGDESSDHLLREIVYAVERAGKQRREREHESVKEALAAMEKTLAIVSHELRTPLAALRATTEYLLSPDARETAEWDVFLGSIHNQVLRMAEFVNNLLDAARMRSGKASWNWGAVQPYSICDEALNVLRPLIDHNVVELSYDVEPENLSMRGDREALTRMLINLLSNAAKYTPSGSIAVSVRSEDDADGRWTSIVVSDTGSGISTDVIEKLGRAFLLNSGAIGSDYLKGTGLGLSICNTIAAVHGGSLHVSSRESFGTTLTVRLRSDLEGPATVTEAPEITVDKSLTDAAA